MMCKYYKDAFVWDIKNSPYQSGFIDCSLEFGKEKPVYLIDQYEGKRPALINRKFLNGENLTFPMYPNALLDSNIVDLLDQYVQNKKLTDGLLEFLHFVTTKGWQLDLNFYYFEHYAKSSLKDFIPNAVRRTMSLMKIYTMDEKYYLDKGEIKSDPEKLDYYLTQENAHSLEELSANRVAKFIDKRIKDELVYMIDAIKIALIKMVLIRKFEMCKATPIEQYHELVRFLVDDVGFTLAREIHFSLFYFFDKAGRLLGIQKNTSFDVALSIINSTAWDLYLSRIPELILCLDREEITVSYVVTQEKKLKELIELFSIDKIISFDGKNIFPAISFDISDFPDAIGNNYHNLGVLELYAKKKTPSLLIEALKNQLKVNLQSI